VHARQICSTLAGLSSKTDRPLTSADEHGARSIRHRTFHEGISVLVEQTTRARQDHFFARIVKSLNELLVLVFCEFRVSSFAWLTVDNVLEPHLRAVRVAGTILNSSCSTVHTS